nr:MAG TPA: hypothetical protein [Herelleviridae sp.]
MFPLLFKFYFNFHVANLIGYFNYPKIISCFNIKLTYR